MRLFAAAFSATLLYSPLAHAECTKDTDCKGDRICVSGACENPTQGDADAKASGSKEDGPVGERRSPAVFGTGIALTVTGGLALTAGTVFLVLGLGGNNEGGLIFGGAIAAGSGSLLLPAGIVMTVIGGERLPPEKKQGVNATFTPWVTPSAGGAAILGSF